MDATIGRLPNMRSLTRLESVVKGKMRARAFKEPLTRQPVDAHNNLLRTVISSTSKARIPRTCAKNRPLSATSVSEEFESLRL